MAKYLRGVEYPGRGKCKITGHGRVSMADVRECVKVCSSHWFDPDTMRFFKSRVGSTAYADGKGGAYFVSSEKGPNNQRAFSVRHFAKCSVDTIGEFQGYHSASSAATVAARLAKVRR